MQIELYIDGEKKLFTAPYVPMLAKRKYLEISAKAEANAKEAGNEYYLPSVEEQIAEDDEMIGILANVVFDGQFTVEQVYKGASNEYVYKKLSEAVFGKPKENKGDEGNQKGK